MTPLKQFVVVFAVAGLFGQAALSADPTAISLDPGKFELRGHRAQQQLIVSGTFSSDDVRDLTHAGVQFASSNPAIVKIEGTLAIPVADGTAQITATLGVAKATAEVTVKEMALPAPVSFKNEMLAALTKAGCNMGACHGSPSGKGGFRLSLRGFDPTIDTLTLRSEFMQRRINPVQPDESLLIKKPLMEVAHGGGRRIKKDDPVHRVFRGWIAEGLRVDTETSPDLVKIEVFPNKRVFRPAGKGQQLVVMGTYSDGSVRDVTPFTVFSSSNEQVGTVSESGLVAKAGRGETAILARLLDKMTTCEITFLEDVPGFAWNNPPPNNFVDDLVFEKLQQLQILPSELCSDEEFVRRVYLDVTGRLPRIEETKAFLSNTAPDKRNQLIDQLVDSDDFADFWTLKWTDILRSNSKKVTAIGTHKFRLWVYESIRSDKPFDQFARELLTASGSVFENPAANYWRASRDPNDAVETTSQLFLGIRIQCAKCHNHPFERWSQDNYYGIAAAFTRVARQKGDRAEEEVIYPTTSGEITQPRTGKQMKVHLLLKGDVDDVAGQDRREVFANWLTSPDNPFFAKAAVNRIWGHLLGRGIVEPVDDFRDSNPPSNARLLNELAAQFINNNYSQKWAVRTILKSRTYQLSSRKNPFNKDDEIYNSHANTRLLSAEQLLDAICQVTNVPEEFAGAPLGTRSISLAEPPTNHYFLKIFGQPQREMACQCERSNESNLSQALQMINGPTVHGKLRADNGRIANFIKENKSDDEIITTLYLAALSRTPSPAELDAAKKHIAAQSDRRLAVEDVGWAILNSKEFLFQH
jgi:hypothetical protein